MSDNYQREGIPMRVSGGDPIHMDVEPARVIEAVSPEVAVSGITGGHRLTVTDLHGEHSFDVMDGAPGQPGQDGQDGAPGQPGQNGRDGAQGQPGQPGADGVSPTVTVTDITGGHRVTITDADGAHSFDVMDGTDGEDGVTDVQVNGTSVVSDGVAEVSMASDTVPGVVKVLSGYGIYLYEDTLRTALPNLGQIKAGNNNTLPLTVSNQHNAAFYGLAKAAGDATQSASSNPVGQYTESAKSAISQMLNSSVSVTGPTPSITALPGIRYVCGECATLGITLPASGIVDVVFESGSTPTVLSGLDNVRWTGDFDPENLEANTTYEINIADELGVAASWT